MIFEDGIITSKLSDNFIIRRVDKVTYVFFKGYGMNLSLFNALFMWTLTRDVTEHMWTLNLKEFNQLNNTDMNIIEIKNFSNKLVENIIAHYETLNHTSWKDKVKQLTDDLLAGLETS